MIGAGDMAVLIMIIVTRIDEDDQALFGTGIAKELLRLEAIDELKALFAQACKRRFGNAGELVGSGKNGGRIGRGDRRVRDGGRSREIIPR